jgi:hypothetical protein
MSERHLKAFAWLEPCAKGREWLCGLPDAMTWPAVWHASPERWQEWIVKRLRIPEELRTTRASPPEGWPQIVREVPALGGRSEAMAFFGRLHGRRLPRVVAEMAHPADAWTVPVLTALPIVTGVYDEREAA